jgi:hypothetical protein
VGHHEEPNDENLAEFRREGGHPVLVLLDVKIRRDARSSERMGVRRRSSIQRGISLGREVARAVSVAKRLVGLLSVEGRAEVQTISDGLTSLWAEVVVEAIGIAGIGYVEDFGR